MAEKTRGFLVSAAPDARAAEGLGLPCVCLYYRIGESGTLQRAQVSLTGRGGLMGVFEGAGLIAAQPEKLARDMQAECARRGFSGVVLDFVPEEEAALSALERLCAGLRRLQVPVWVPEALADRAGEGSLVIAPAAVSGGSFSDLLDALAERYGSERLCLDLVRCCSDFPMPSPDPDGTPLSPAAFRELQEQYRPQSFFSPQLCCKYFTYRKPDGSAHFVLFDDLHTAGQKLAAIRERGIGFVFLLYSEWGAEAKTLLK
ncbi:MAG: hypothetical protein IJA84_03855 [Clostridia bacterium]|nr:hypothetical protein [Clostridia bacterium]